MANSIRAKYDIIINGGGIVGFTLLNLLLKSPYLSRAKVLLIEQSMRPTNLDQWPRVDSSNKDTDIGDTSHRKFSNRVSSITLASKQAYKQLGIWDTVRPYAKDVRNIHVWNYDYNHRIDFRQDLPTASNHDREERDIMFSTLENNRLSAALLNELINNLRKDETIAWATSLERLEESVNSGLIDVVVQTDESDLTSTSAPLILGCDGFGSKVRELTNMPYREIDLKKTAVVGTVKIQTQLMNSENSIAYQRFSPAKDTVAALLPLDNEYSSFVISAPNDYASFLKDCDKDAFLDEFNKLLSEDEVASNIALRGLHEVSNAAYDNLKALLQLVGPRLGLSDGYIDLSSEMAERPVLQEIVENSRATFPLSFGTTSPKMVTSLPGLDRTQIALLGDSSHKLHPLAGQGLNLGIQDAIELVKQLETIATSGENIYNNTELLSKALGRYELKRQAYVIPMSASILAMQSLFKLAPSRAISSVNKCQPMKALSVRLANGC